MIARPELTTESLEVKSSPNNFYVDAEGRVNELEDDEERILFGTVEHPSNQWFDEPPPMDPEERLWKEAEHDIRVAFDPELNIHLKIFDALFGPERTKK